VIFLGDFSFVKIFLKNYCVTMTTTLNTSRSENTMVLSARVSACMYFLVYLEIVLSTKMCDQKHGGFYVTIDLFSWGFPLTRGSNVCGRQSDLSILVAL
jgi:hypothetical protein